MVNVWVLKPPSQVLQEEIDGFLACYSMCTGNTHIFDAFPAAIIRQLASAPKSSDQISIHLAEQMGEKAGDWVDRIDDILRQLEHLQLVEMRVK